VKGKKDGFVTVFPFHSFLFWHYLYKNLFSRTNRKDSAKGFKTFFKVDGKFVAILFFYFSFF